MFVRSTLRAVFEISSLKGGVLQRNDSGVGKKNVGAEDVAFSLSKLKLNLCERKVNNFISSQAMALPEKLERAAVVDAKHFTKEQVNYTRNAHHIGIL